MRTLEITTKVSNCLGCHFCPQEKLGKAYSGTPSLSFEAFSNALLKIPKDVQIHFSGFSEPFLNKNCGEMISHAWNQGYEIHLYTTLVGLTVNQLEWLKQSKPRVIRLHVPDRKFLKIDPDAWLRQFHLFNQLGQPFTAMAMGEIDSSLKITLSEMGVNVELPDMLSRGGNLWRARRIEGKLRCTMNRWNSNVMLPNGDVYLCCMDYSLSASVGNIFREEYESILLSGDSFRATAKSGLAPEICRDCEWAAPL